MSRTNHHRNQKQNRCGYDYGGRYKHNKHYGGGYGVDGRNAADKERRHQSKEYIEDELDLYVAEVDPISEMLERIRNEG